MIEVSRDKLLIEAEYDGNVRTFIATLNQSHRDALTEIDAMDVGPLRFLKVTALLASLAASAASYRGLDTKAAGQTVLADFGQSNADEPNPSVSKADQQKADQLLERIRALMS